MNFHDRLRITEIFFSLQGETRTVGVPTVFIRLTGCPLRCGYCDTAYAFQGGKGMSHTEIIESVAKHPTQHVTVTGGEPLAQPGCTGLLEKLCDAGYIVSLETSGAFDISVADIRVSRVMDFKTPGSSEMHRNRYENIGHLTSNDQVKFVLCDRADYEWAKKFTEEHALSSRCDVFFSPVWQQLAAEKLAEWILVDGLPVRLQIQLHKYLWGEVPGK